MDRAIVRRAALAGLALLAAAAAPAAAQPGPAAAPPGGAPAQPQGVDPNADWHRTVDDVLGRPGTEQPGGVWRISLPRTDLKVTLDGVELRPAFALGSWLAFKKVGDQVAVMGDLVLTDAEINPVMKHLAANGIDITAIHNHVLRASP